ncbi:unnamed protein product [Pedinophyceae sp. YPF-701]|nr:unnamed protein product [Pedinophyceae sp. YPF-701]
MSDGDKQDRGAGADLFHRVLREVPSVIAGLDIGSVRSLAAASPAALNSVLRLRKGIVVISHCAPLLEVLAREPADHLSPHGRALDAMFLVMASERAGEPLEIRGMRLRGNLDVAQDGRQSPPLPPDSAAAAHKWALGNLLARPALLKNLRLFRATDFQHTAAYLDHIFNAPGSSFANLTTMSFMRCQLRGRESDLARVLRGTRLTDLNAAECGLTQGGACEILGALSGSLKHLNISHNAVGDAGAAALASAMGSLPRLETLRAIKCEIRPAGMRTLAAAVRTHRSLARLVLTENTAGPAGMVALSDAVCACKTMASLELDNVAIGNGGAEAVAKLLRESSLQLLSLRDNALTDPGLQVIMHGLRANKSLERLDLFANDAEDGTFRVLCDAIEVHPRLRHVDVSGPFNGLGGAAIERFARFSESLQRKPPLRTLMFSVDSNAVADRVNSIQRLEVWSGAELSVLVALPKEGFVIQRVPGNDDVWEVVMP